MTRNQILYQQTVEQMRTNRANEAINQQRNVETARSNLANELETHRANRAREVETNRSNLARELETNRSNLASEAENRRSHIAIEALRSSELGETKRSNLARELETAQHNRASETEASTHNRAAESELERSNRAREAETTRGNTLQYQSNLARAQATQAAARISAAANQAIEELRQQGMNERQLKQIGADAIKVLHDDLLKLLNSGSGQSFIKNVIQEWVLKQIRGGN